jgi:hypothetical protein
METQVREIGFCWEFDLEIDGYKGGTQSAEGFLDVDPQSYPGSSFSGHFFPSTLSCLHG